MQPGQSKTPRHDVPKRFTELASFAGSLATEGELARLIIANEHVDKLRTLARLLQGRGIVTNAYYHDMLDSLDYIAAALQTGKKNTAKLRNGDRE